MRNPEEHQSEPCTAASGATRQLLTKVQVSGPPGAFFADEVSAWIASRERATLAVQADRAAPFAPQDRRS
jgi:hypothetical protein